MLFTGIFCLLAGLAAASTAAVTTIIAAAMETAQADAAPASGAGSAHDAAVTPTAQPSDRTASLDWEDAAVVERADPGTLGLLTSLNTGVRRALAKGRRWSAYPAGPQPKVAKRQARPGQLVPQSGAAEAQVQQDQILDGAGVEEEQGLDNPPPTQRKGSGIPWSLRQMRVDAAAQQNQPQRRHALVASAESHKALLYSCRNVLHEHWQHSLDTTPCPEHPAGSLCTAPSMQRLDNEPLLVKYVNLQDSFMLKVPQWQCTGCRCGASVDPVAFFCWPSSPVRASTWYDIRLFQHYARVCGRGLSMEGFLDALNATHNPLTLYKPKPLNAASFGAAFADYRHATDRLLTLPGLLGGSHSDMMPEGAFADCPLCCFLPGAPRQDGYTRVACTDACLQPSSYAGTATATRDIEQHIDTYLDRNGLEGDVRELQKLEQLTLSGVFVAAAEAGRAAAEAAGLTPNAAAATDFGDEAHDCATALSCARPATSSSSAGQPCDMRGVVGFVCCHGIPLLGLFCNLVTPEQFVYYLLAMWRLVDQCQDSVLHIYVDFACRLKVTWARFAAALGLCTANVHLMVNWMHGSSHNLSCQLKNNGRYLANTAWRVGEQTEQLWSMFKVAISPLLRYMTRANRADAIQARLADIAFDKQAGVVDFLQGQDADMVKKEAELEVKERELSERAAADGVTDVVMACEAFVDSCDPRPFSALPNDAWKAEWMSLQLELKSHDGLASAEGKEGAQPRMRLPSIPVSPDLALLLTRAGKSTHQQRVQMVQSKCLALEIKHQVDPLEWQMSHEKSALIESGLDLLISSKLSKYRTQTWQLAMDARDMSHRRDTIGRSGKDTKAISRGIKAKLRQARLQLDEMALWQEVGSCLQPQQLPAPRVTDEQLQAMVRGKPAPWDEEFMATPRGKLLHYGRLFHQLHCDRARCKEQLAVLAVEHGRLQSWLQHMISVCDVVCASDAADPGCVFYIKQHHEQYTAMLAKAQLL
ncbi:hypothetical protein QJQ45_016030 [Haematococcus lacustris]|nr:hypothetical protein QJQ45_016030 [Haematococcus lacustris]